ncbi:EamA family transporter [Mycobacterium sp. CVI_P3]|uniref:EamA family transporter n=1 Tax=Mycobacterium pinniadriaticum TaxID=2994102 RepID=A0ABT3SFM4_9MYCO|nr:EamA family transporter [Mycobacterium pinniadriaticum]MCX2931086.1 EamA family transporter [Mycobacterium pinniadriaticum]MCX2937690.1 EamA family transporter [Mycobacterium pinniadriaticum]
MSTTVRGLDHFRLGLLFAVGSAFTFGMSGPFAKALMGAGWSPTAAVAARLAGGALVMAIFASVVKPGWLREARAHARTVVAYGLVPIAGAQLCYYNAVAHLSVGVALLLEYTAPILVVGWIWGTTRRRPRTVTLAGVALAVAGIMLVLNVFSGAAGPATSGTGGAHINAVGVAWGLAAAICAACYFMMSDEVSADGSGLNSITLAAGGLIVGAIAVGLLGLTGVMPLVFTADNAAVAGMTVPWWIPVIMLAVVATAVAYTLGISGVARLRPSFASLVGLGEVLFAVLSAWALLGEAITVTQAIGGGVVLLGLALARQGDRGTAVTAATWPDAGPMEEVATPAPA